VCCVFSYLMTPQARPRNINDIMPMIGARFYSQLEMSHVRNDMLENELSKVCVMWSEFEG
jgi:PAB-dependent poly(A)-specific ribonuclease subunit 3